MRRTPRSLPSPAGTAPSARGPVRPAGHRLAAPLAVLLAVLLALLPGDTGNAQADPVRGPATGTGAPADPHRTDPHRTDPHRTDPHRTDPHRTVADPRPGAPAGTHSDPRAGSVPVPTAPHADDPWTPGSWAQVRARHDHLAERPAPPDHPLAGPGGTAPVPGEGTYDPAPRACPPVSPGRSAHDRGRAPPARTGS
ncbi:hypothetical protein ACFYVL_41450 [Streptomyces sp. NPDC004111]|uniref:hypothetical protein n=1 Tax=Streptomyces sp. NPDC004111 TaxID=3364690 RepID=UPI0036D0602C